MSLEPDYDELAAALLRCGAAWEPAQAHGLLTARLALEGRAAAAGVLQQVLEHCEARDALVGEAAALLQASLEQTFASLEARMSAFEPLLPADDAPAALRAEALAHWCEGFLHGLVASDRDRAARLAERLAADPIADIIKDMLQITRAVVDADDGDGEEEAYAELVEYLRVSAQIVYEELADLRPGMTP
jgi:uncharacterized protein